MDYLNILSSDSEDEERAPRQRKVYRPRINFEVPNEFQFKEKFRMKSTEFEYLLSITGQQLLNATRNTLYALTPRQQLLVALRFFGNGGSYHGVADMHGISKSTVCVSVRRVVDVIVDHHFQQIVRFPPNMANVAAEFLRIGKFPSVAGCVDGTLINILSPKDNEEQFVDRDGNHSINAMMVSGPDYSFYHVNARWPGSAHDARVLRTSSLSQKFESGWRPFPGAVLLGDSGYPLKNWLITPYHHNPNDEAENKFNVRHKSTRRIVECAYGILKNRFPCLRYLRVCPIQAAKIIMTCATLHNLCSADDFYEEPPQSPEMDDTNPNQSDSSGLARVQELLNYFR